MTRTRTIAAVLAFYLSLIVLLATTSPAQTFTPPLTPLHPVYGAAITQLSVSLEREGQSLSPSNGTGGVGQGLFEPPAQPPSQSQTQTQKYTLQQIPYSSLPQAASLLVSSFYPPSPLRPAHTLKELNRLQQNYCHDSSLHVMLSLLPPSSPSGTPPLAFVDIDGRPNRRDGLVPYLSDLAVSPSHRKRGLATALVRRCEDLALGWGYDKLYIKVRRDNESARRLYGRMGYAVVEGGETMLLCREFGDSTAA